MKPEQQENMKPLTIKSLIILLVLLVLSILMFYGSIFMSLETHDPIYVIVGYPLTGLLLGTISILRKRRK